MIRAGWPLPKVKNRTAWSLPKKNWLALRETGDQLGKKSEIQFLGILLFGLDRLIFNSFCFHNASKPFQNRGKNHWETPRHLFFNVLGKVLEILDYIFSVPYGGSTGGGPRHSFFNVLFARRRTTIITVKFRPYSENSTDKVWPNSWKTLRNKL